MWSDDLLTTACTGSGRRPDCHEASIVHNFEMIVCTFGSCSFANLPCSSSQRPASVAPHRELTLWEAQGLPQPPKGVSADVVHPKFKPRSITGPPAESSGVEFISPNACRCALIAAAVAVGQPARPDYDRNSSFRSMGRATLPHLHSIVLGAGRASCFRGQRAHVFGRTSLAGMNLPIGGLPWRV